MPEKYHFIRQMRSPRPGGVGTQYRGMDIVEVPALSLAGVSKVSRAANECRVDLITGRTEHCCD